MTLKPSVKGFICIGLATVPEKAYVGQQQVMVEYKLYTAINIENYTIAHTPDFKGFYIENIPN